MYLYIDCSIRSIYCFSIMCSTHFLIIDISGLKRLLHCIIISCTRSKCDSSFLDFITLTIEASIIIRRSASMLIVISLSFSLVSLFKTGLNRIFTFLLNQNEFTLLNPCSLHILKTKMLIFWLP
jgi:hypothetical protein